MFFFRSKERKELDFCVREMKNYLANNYKDLAHQCRRLLGEKSDAYFTSGHLTPKQYHRYQAVFRHYTALMKDYHH